MNMVNHIAYHKQMLYIQNDVISELNKIAITHLYALGYKDIPEYELIFYKPIQIDIDSYQLIEKMLPQQPNTIHYELLDLYKQYDLMDNEPLYSTLIDLYTEQIVKEFKIETSDICVKQILSNLFYDVLNIEFNLFMWVRDLLKYGNFYLYIDINEQRGVTGCHSISPYQIQRIQIQHDNISKELYFRINNTQSIQYYKIIHFRILSDSKLLPYGTSIFYNRIQGYKQFMLDNKIDVNQLHKKYDLKNLLDDFFIP